MRGGGAVAEYPETGGDVSKPCVTSTHLLT